MVVENRKYVLITSQVSVIATVISHTQKSARHQDGNTTCGNRRYILYLINVKKLQFIHMLMAIDLRKFAHRKQQK